MALSQEDLRTLQLRTLALYQFFETFCLTHGLRLFVCGGGLIGAVRQGGFLPWDDDLDVFMPRADYDRLWALWQRDGDCHRYHLAQPGHGTRYGETLSYLFDLTAPCVREPPRPNVPACLSLDILPLDGRPANPVSRASQLLWASVYGLCTVGRPPERHGPWVRTACRVLLSLVPGETRQERAARYAQRRMSRWSARRGWTELCSGWKYLGKRYGAEVFASMRVLSFEAATIRAPADPDAYLKEAFGDYLTPPPMAQRVPDHGLCSIGFGREC